MTLEATESTVRYVGNGATTEFGFPFRAWSADQVEVYVGNGDVEQEVSASCTIDVTETGGTVTFAEAPAEGVAIVIQRSMPYTQEDNYTNGSRFDGEEVEDRFDMDAAERQDLKRDIGRAVKTPVTSSLSGDELVSDLYQARQDAVDAVEAIGGAEEVMAARDAVVEAFETAGEVTGATRIAASAGASALRSLSERCSDFVNVKDFGAKGDGSTNDTTAWGSFETALASGGIGYVPAGDYLVNNVHKVFPNGCIGTPKSGYSSIKPGHTNRFSNAIPIGQKHVIDITRSLTINGWDATEGQSSDARIYPSISINADITVPDTAPSVDLDGNLIASCHGIYLQHILRGGNANNQLCTTGLVTNAVNDALGDNDCSGVAARATKTGDAGIGDTAGLGGRVDNYSHNKGGVMGAELVCYNNVTGIPCPSDFSDVSTSRWATPLHVTGTASKPSNGTATSSPMTAAILVQGGGETPPYWDGLQFSYSMFPSFASSQPSITKNEIPNNDGSASSSYPGTTQAFESYTYTSGKTEYTRYRLPDTVAINMGSFSQSNGYPDTCIKMGYAKQHIWTPNQSLIVKAKGQRVSAAGNIGYYADTTNAGNTSYAFSHSGTNVASIVHVGTSTASTLTLNNTAAGTGVVLTATSLRKTTASSALTLGENSYPWANVYADTGPWAGSDERLKTNIDGVDEALMRAWGRVNFKVFQFRDAVAAKGEEFARLHVGVIAQHVQAAFEAEGLDASRYGLFGFDSWEAKDAQYNEWDEEIAAEFDEDGTVLAPAHTVHHKDLTAPAEEGGERYSIRYDEALALECAYQRWRLEQLEERINQLTSSNG